MINVGELKNKYFEYIIYEMEEIVKICKEAGKISKVIFDYYKDWMDILIH